MLASHWAHYATMVSEITRHDWDYVMKKLAYAKGLQARTIWWQLKKIECEAIGTEQSSLKTIIR